MSTGSLLDSASESDSKGNELKMSNSHSFCHSPRIIGRDVSFSICEQSSTVGSPSVL